MPEQARVAAKTQRISAIEPTSQWLIKPLGLSSGGSVMEPPLLGSRMLTGSPGRAGIASCSRKHWTVCVDHHGLGSLPWKKEEGVTNGQ